MAHFLVELSLREALEEVATVILKQTWLYYHHAINLCLYYGHIIVFIVVKGVIGVIAH